MKEFQQRHLMLSYRRFFAHLIVIYFLKCLQLTSSLSNMLDERKLIVHLKRMSKLFSLLLQTYSKIFTYFFAQIFHY